MSLKILRSHISHIKNETLRYSINASATIGHTIFSRQKSHKSWSSRINITPAEKLKASYPFPSGNFVDTRKVTVVGSGRAAVSSTLALLATSTSREVCMLGLGNICKLRGEEMDIKQASVFLNNPKIFATQDPADSKGSEICVLATGTEQGEDEDNYEYTARNIGTIRAAIPHLMKYSPEAVYLIASDPVDVLTREAWIAGGMHQSRILGTGTNLYSAMLRSLMSKRLRVHAASCHGLVLGQNNPSSNPCVNSGGAGEEQANVAALMGIVALLRQMHTVTVPKKKLWRLTRDETRSGFVARVAFSSEIGTFCTQRDQFNAVKVPVWSGTTVQGIRLADVCPEIGTEADPERWQEHYDGMIKDEQVVRKLKGGYNWAAALSIVDICQTILNNSQDIRPVSTFAQGKHNIAEDVFLSLPCVLGSKGVVSVLKQHLSAKESFLLRKDASRISQMQSQMEIAQNQTGF